MPFYDYSSKITIRIQRYPAFVQAAVPWVPEILPRVSHVIPHYERGRISGTQGKAAAVQ